MHVTVKLTIYNITKYRYYTLESKRMQSNIIYTSLQLDACLDRIILQCMYYCMVTNTLCSTLSSSNCRFPNIAKCFTRDCRMKILFFCCNTSKISWSTNVLWIHVSVIWHSSRPIQGRNLELFKGKSSIIKFVF
jgi:hypothetical protein